MTKPRNWVFPLMRLFSWVAPGIVAVLALFAAIAFGIWQSSHQLIFTSSISDVVWLFWAAVFFLAVQFAARLYVEVHEEQASIRKTTAIRAIGDFIGEGVKLKDKFSSLPRPETNDDDSPINIAINDWNKRTTEFMEGYEPQLALMLSDTSGVLPLDFPNKPFAYKIESRLIRLRELLFLVAVR